MLWSNKLLDQQLDSPDGASLLDLESAFNQVDKSCYLLVIRRVCVRFGPMERRFFASLNRALCSSEANRLRSHFLGPSPLCPAPPRNKGSHGHRLGASLDLASFYLDDGTVASTFQAPTAFLQSFEHDHHERGLDLCYANVFHVVASQSPELGCAV